VTAPMSGPMFGPVAGSMIQPMTGRYVLPSYVERTSYGMKESNPCNKLFEERIVFVGAPVDDALANDVIAQLVALEGMETIGLYG
jgi:ATP-dependent Clp protease protease subunit